MYPSGMATPPSQKNLMRQWVENWQVVTEESERLKTQALRALTEEEAARQFNDLDCDPALLWRSPERVLSSGLIEQQRLFSQLHERPPGPRRRS